MDQPVKPIANVQGADSATIQALFRTLVARWQPSARIVGVVEAAADEGDAACGGARLRNIGDGSSYPLFQALGTGASACALDAEGVILACEAVRRDIAAGCDLVVLSKFGKLEAESRSGLIPAFAAAIEAGVPVLTSVSPKYTGAWEAFAAPMFQSLPADAQAIEGWWHAHRR